MMGGHGAGAFDPQRFASNGEQIYYTGFSRSTGPIRFQGGPHWLQMHGGGCVACHGVTGRGGVPVMMGTAIPEGIRYHVLTTSHEEAEEAEGQSGTSHEHGESPYTDVTIKRAITQGIDSSGKRLDATMPRWQMSEQDLNDVIAYLKTLN
jgi:mono/diheme cytochrome c family protein